MKRLTGRAPDGTAYLYNMGGTNAAIDRLAAYEDTGLEPTIIKYRLDAVNACVNSALSVINEFAAEMEDYCVYSRIYQAVAAIGEEDQNG